MLFNDEFMMKSDSNINLTFKVTISSFNEYIRRVKIKKLKKKSVKKKHHKRLKFLTVTRMYVYMFSF